MNEEVAVVVIRDGILNVSVIKTANLVFLSGAEMASRNLVDDEQQDAGYEERPRSASCSARQLKTQLAKVAVPPTAVVGVAHTIKCGDHLVGKKTGEDVANVTADAMNCENVKSVVDTEEILVFDGVVRANRFFEQTAPQVRLLTEACSRCNSNQASNDAGTESNKTELLDIEVVEQYPGDSTTASSEIRVDNDVDGSETEIGCAGAVERKPPEPDENRSKDHQQRVMRFEVRRVFLLRHCVVTKSWAKHHRPCKGSEAAGNVDGARAGEVVEAKVVEPATGIPFPVCQTTGNKCCPAEKKEHAWPETAALQHRARQDHCCSCDEGESERSI